jgi:hypothetical protein
MRAEQRGLVAGWEERPVSAPVAASAVPSAEPKPRLKAVNRRRLCFRAIDPERRVGEEPPVRTIWDLLGRRDLSRFYAGIQAVEGRPGRETARTRGC